MLTQINSKWGWTLKLITGEFIIKPVVIFGPNVQKLEFENVFPFGSMTTIWLSPWYVLYAMFFQIARSRITSEKLYGSVEMLNIFSRVICVIFAWWWYEIGPKGEETPHLSSTKFNFSLREFSDEDSFLFFLVHYSLLPIFFSIFL